MQQRTIAIQNIVLHSTVAYRKVPYGTVRHLHTVVPYNTYGTRTRNEYQVQYYCPVRYVRYNVYEFTVRYLRRHADASSRLIWLIWLIRLITPITYRTVHCMYVCLRKYSRESSTAVCINSSISWISKQERHEASGKKRSPWVTAINSSQPLQDIIEYKSASIFN